MQPLQAGVLGSVVLFAVGPAVVLMCAVVLSVYEVYRIGERKLLILIAILALMLQHQVLEAYTFWRTGEAVAEGLGEVFETGANLIAAGSVYYVLRFARRERRLVRDLERSELQYRNLIERSPVPTLVHDDSGIRYANDAAVELFDADDRAAVTGVELPAFVIGETPEHVRETVLADGGSDEVESRVRTLDGRTRHAVLTGAPTDYGGTDLRQVVLRDITERKRREREYEQIFNNVHDTITIGHPGTGEFIEVNDSFCELMGYGRDRILEMGVEGVSDADEGFTMERGRKIIHEVMETGESQQFEWAVETSDGETRWLEVWGSPAEIGGKDRYLSIGRDVTEQRRREREFEQIFDMAGDGIVIHDPESGEVVDANQQVADLLGYDREAFVDRPLSEFQATDEGVSGQQAREKIVESAREGSQEFEWPLETADGETVWVRARHEIGEIGGEQRIVALLHDITERKRREREYEQIFEGVNDAIAVHDPETGEMLAVNERLCEITGYDRDTLAEIGATGLTVATDEFSPERVPEIVDRVMEGEDIEPYEQAIETSDGERRWLEVNPTHAVIDGEERFLAISRDVTARRERQQRLEAERDRRANLFENTPDPIMAVEFKHGQPHITEVNPSFEEAFGFDAESVADRPIADAIVPEEEREGYEQIRQHALSGEPVEAEVRRETASGVRDFLLRVLPFESGGDRHAYVWYTDITERKRREQRLEVFNRVLRHNLRNQLDVIRSHAEALSDSTDGAHADRIIASADRLSTLGERARTIDRYMSRERDPSPVDLSRVVDETLDSIDAPDHDVTTTLDLPESTPVVTDKRVLGTVLENALDNAIRYAKSTVAVTVTDVSDGYALTIDDDGPGIPSEELAALDAETETDLQHGRGLGLWQLKWGVEELGGDLSFDTSQGTRVRITVPDLGATTDGE